MPVYLALQPMGCAAPHVAMKPGGLLPRLFTLTTARRIVAVVFCHTCPGIAAGFLLGNMVLCVARTFLMPANADPRRNVRLRLQSYDIFTIQPKGRQTPDW